MTLLNTLTASNSSSLQDITSITSAYAYYKIVFRNVIPMTSNDYLTMQYCISGEWVTDNQYNTENWGNDTGGNDATSDTDTCLHVWQQARTGPAVNSGVFGEMTLFDPLSTSTPTCYIAHIYAPTAFNNKGCQIFSAGAYLGNELPVTGLSFAFKNGNINSGVIEIYGCN